MLRHVLVPALVFVAFTVFSFEVLAADGFFGLYELLENGGWGLQLMFDIVLAVSSFLVLAAPEAKRLGIPMAPYVAASLALGSIGILAFFIHRGVVLARGEREEGDARAV